MDIFKKNPPIRSTCPKSLKSSYLAQISPPVTNIVRFQNALPFDFDRSRGQINYLWKDIEGIFPTLNCLSYSYLNQKTLLIGATPYHVIQEELLDK